MFDITRYRSTKHEIMDDLSMEGETLRKTLDQIAGINRLLGGNKTTISGLISLLNTVPDEGILTIADLGCGNGEMLRMVADHGRKTNRNFRLIGIDANDYTISYARRLSAAYPEISYVKMDVLDEALGKMEFDIVLATLFLHHFTGDEIIRLLKKLINRVSTGIVINDLHRCRRAYYLFRLISIFIPNPMVRHDGAVSVLRGFKRNEFIKIQEQLAGTSSTLKWVWAFRYRWTISKQCQ